LDIPIGVIPAGTANDFAGAIGMSKDPLKAAEQIATGEIIRVDCGKVNDIYFVNIFSFGLFTTTSQRTPDEQKHRWGKLAYIAEGIKELRRMRKIPLEIRADGEHFSLDTLIALIFNGETAGGFRLARRSSIQDGHFECLLLEKRNFLHACWTMVRYLLGGDPKAIRHLHVRSLEIHSTVNELTDVDGQRGAEFPLSVHCLEGALRIQCHR
jgi:YegS/Rv2252/BmrU family lipid kinase